MEPVVNPEQTIQIEGLPEGIGTVGALLEHSKGLQKQIAANVAPDSYNFDGMQEAFKQVNPDTEISFAETQDGQWLATVGKEAGMTQAQIEKVGSSVLAAAQMQEEANIAQWAEVFESPEKVTELANKVAAHPLTKDMDLQSMGPQNAMALAGVLDKLNAIQPQPGGDGGGGVGGEWSVKYDGKTYTLNPDDDESRQAFMSQTVTTKVNGKEFTRLLVDVSREAYDLYQKGLQYHAHKPNKAA